MNRHGCVQPAFAHSQAKLHSGLGRRPLHRFWSPCLRRSAPALDGVHINAASSCFLHQAQCSRTGHSVYPLNPPCPARLRPHAWSATPPARPQPPTLTACSMLRNMHAVQRCWADRLLAHGILCCTQPHSRVGTGALLPSAGSPSWWRVHDANRSRHMPASQSQLHGAMLVGTTVHVHVGTGVLSAGWPFQTPPHQPHVAHGGFVAPQHLAACHVGALCTPDSGNGKRQSPQISHRSSWACNVQHA